MAEKKKHPRAGQQCLHKWKDRHGIWRTCHKTLNDKGRHFGAHKQ